MGDLDWLADEPIEEVESDFGPLEEGWYELIVMRAELRDNRAGTGKYMNIGAQTDSGRWVWTKYNVQHQNKKAERIARNEFNQLCVACGARGRVRDSQWLVGKSFRGYLVIEEWNGNRDNRIKRTEPSAHAEDGPTPIMASEIPAGWG